jgi:hypothetical protein
MSGVLSLTLPVETAEHGLKRMLEQLHLGETITLVGAEGVPLAVIVSLQKPATVEAEPASDWEARWDALARKVSQAWKGEKGAVETLVEMRR